MKRYLIPILVILVLASGLVVGCNSGADLSKEDLQIFVIGGNNEGYLKGYWATITNEYCYFTRPNKVEEAQKFLNGYEQKINLRDFYIPKGYITMEDLAAAHHPDGTSYSDKEKRQAMEGYNWGYYQGFLDAVDDCAEGRANRYSDLP
jgi:hypothetical protein